MRAKYFPSINSINLPISWFRRVISCVLLYPCSPINLPSRISLPLQFHSTYLLSRDTKGSTVATINSNAWHVAQTGQAAHLSPRPALGGKGSSKCDWTSTAVSPACSRPEWGVCAETVIFQLRDSHWEEDQMSETDEHEPMGWKERLNKVQVNKQECVLYWNLLFCFETSHRK